VETNHRGSRGYPTDSLYGGNLITLASGLLEVHGVDDKYAKRLSMMPEM
jgi:hypothetical protein